MRRLFAYAVAAALSVGVATATAQTDSAVIDEAPSAPAMAVDLIVIRPLSLAMTIVGTGLYVIQLPLDLIQMDFETPARKLVVEPAQYTFTRPLGQLE